MDSDRFATDSDEDAPGNGSVSVAAIQPDTFKRCREGFYPSPASYPRTRESFGYMAVYRTAPVPSITHCERVTDRVC